MSHWKKVVAIKYAGDYIYRMNEAARKEVENIRDFTRLITTRQQAREYLIKTGIYNADGSLSEDYGGTHGSVRT